MRDDTQIRAYMSQCHACHGITMVTTDEPSHKRDTARLVGAAIRAGHVISQGTVAEIKTQIGVLGWCRCRRTRKKSHTSSGPGRA